MTSATAVYLLAEFFGGAEVGKAILAAQLKVGRLRARTRFLKITQIMDFGSQAIKNGQPLPPIHDKIQQVERGGGIVELFLGSWASSAWEEDVSAWDWETGNFSVRRHSDDAVTMIECSYHGVRFARPDVERLLPSMGGKVKDGRANSGAKKSDAWHAWIAELALCVYAGDVDPIKSYNGLIKLIAGKLDKKKIPCPGDETVRPAATAVLNALWADALKSNIGYCRVLPP